MQDTQVTIENLIKKQSVAFIGSIDDDGFPCVKAMLPSRKQEGIKTFYFSTNTSSMHVSQYKNNSKACLYFCDKRFFRGVVLKGNMEILEDKSSKEMIWQNGDTMYYSKGITDPDYCVMRFTTVSGRFYSNFKSKDFIV